MNGRKGRWTAPYMNWGKIKTFETVLRKSAPEGLWTQMATKLLPRADELPMQFYFLHRLQTSIPFTLTSMKAVHGTPEHCSSVFALLICEIQSRCLVANILRWKSRVNVQSLKIMRNWRFHDSFPCCGLNITAPVRVTQHLMQISCCSLVIAPKSARRTSLGREIGCETLNFAEHAITRGVSSLAFIKFDLTSQKHVVLQSDFVDARSSVRWNSISASVLRDSRLRQGELIN